MSMLAECSPAARSTNELGSIRTRSNCEMPTIEMHAQMRKATKHAPHAKRHARRSLRRKGAFAGVTSTFAAASSTSTAAEVGGILPPVCILGSDEKMTRVKKARRAIPLGHSVGLSYSLSGRTNR